jgi:hypothetical protein
MNDEHNEQVLWFTRRIIELEAAVKKNRDDAELARGEYHNERRLADRLAEQLRAAARAGLITGVTLPTEELPRAEAIRQGGGALPLEEWRSSRPSFLFYRERTVKEPTDEPWP